MTLCDECHKKSICNTLCPEAEMFASQDQVCQKEITVSEIGVNINGLNIENWPVKDTFSPKQAQIANALGLGYTHRRVCQIFQISSNTLRWHIYKIRQKSFATSL